VKGIYRFCLRNRIHRHNENQKIIEQENNDDTLNSNSSGP
jgi:hypothetical protein